MIFANYNRPVPALFAITYLKSFLLTAQIESYDARSTLIGFNFVLRACVPLDQRPGNSTSLWRAFKIAQRSRSLAQTRRIAASGDDIGLVSKTIMRNSTGRPVFLDSVPIRTFQGRLFPERWEKGKNTLSSGLPKFVN